MRDEEGEKEVGQRLCDAFSGPILFHYVWWILRQASERKFRRLYFLSRDGYLLWKIAGKFCSTFHLPVECRYLYVSRLSLRLPTYHAIGDEAKRLLSLDAYRVTPSSLLQRAGLTEEERKEIYADCGWREVEETRPLNRKEKERLCDRLQRSGRFQRLVREHSEAAYRNAVGYLRQEGLFEEEEVGIADSGWSGSIQRSIRQLMEEAGYGGKITGFYFGLFERPKEERDGTYVTWYFQPESGLLRKVRFCNILFECLLSAPHEMTAGYVRRNGRYEPEFHAVRGDTEPEFVRRNLELALDYADREVKKIDFFRFPEKQLRKDTEARIYRYMVCPRREEAAYYGRYRFCDDLTESYFYSLAEPSQVPMLKRYFVPVRLWKRLFPDEGSKEAELYWPYGTIAFLPRWERWWYRLNVILWKGMRYAAERP